MWTTALGGLCAQIDDEAPIEPHWATDWDGAAQPAPYFDVDQRVDWWRNVFLLIDD